MTCLRSALLVLLLLASGSTLASKFPYSGSWFYPPQNGHGFNFEILENGQMIIYWYTYTPDGSSTFLVGVGNPTGTDGQWTATLNQTAGMVFGTFDPADLDGFEWGTITVTFSDCDSGTVSWNSTQPGYPPGMIPIQRLSTIEGLDCVDSRVAGNYAIDLLDEDGAGFGRFYAFPDGTFAYTALADDGLEVGVGTYQEGDDGFNWASEGFVVNDPDDDSGSAQSTFDGWVSLSDDGTLIEAHRLSSFQRGITLQELAGSYNATDVGTQSPLGQVTIGGDGSVSGNLVGCSLDGTLTVPSESQNQVQVDIDYTGCGSGTFIGGGDVIDGAIVLVIYEAGEGALLVDLAKN